MQLGARGTSILFASGDGGVSGSQSARLVESTFLILCTLMHSGLLDARLSCQHSLQGVRL